MSEPSQSRGSRSSILNTTVFKSIAQSEFRGSAPSKPDPDVLNRFYPFVLFCSFRAGDDEAIGREAREVISTDYYVQSMAVLTGLPPRNVRRRM